jgi:hypothetical protein
MVVKPDESITRELQAAEKCRIQVMYERGWPPCLIMIRPCIFSVWQQSKVALKRRPVSGSCMRMGLV